MYDPAGFWRRFPGLLDHADPESLMVPFEMIVLDVFGHDERKVALAERDDFRQALGDGAPFVLTGPERWNALGLGTSAVFATPLVYNTKRSGRFSFGGRQFLLRRVAFPKAPSPEWFVIDLFENAEMAAASPTDLAAALEAALRDGRFDRARLSAMSGRYGSKRTQAPVTRALDATAG